MSYQWMRILKRLNDIDKEPLHTYVEGILAARHALKCAWKHRKHERSITKSVDVFTPSGTIS